MLETFVKEIKELCEDAGKVQEIDGKKFSIKQLYEVKTKDEVNRLLFKDLSSIVPIVKNEIACFNSPLYVVVDDYDKVYVTTSLDAECDRDYPYQVEYDGTSFAFGRKYSFEEFVIALRSKFVQNDDISELLTFLKNVTNSSTVSVEDDGVTQKVSSTKGIAGGNGYQQTAPIRRLAPFRTFSEIEQPTSEFLFRISDGGYFALHEADGGAWKKQAKDNIKAYYEEVFTNEIKDGKIIILS